jgi:AraC family transcriptional regulator, regulatory protein of adaptative response / DNA-3-methyladenine glycosylase II
MSLDFETCYRAAQSRDTRFDGRFFIAVTSTGVYCRPICPAQMPLARNIRFYPSAAAAEAAGFRACRRCRPDASPTSPDWNVRADLVGRALRLIAEGTADAGGVDGLARRLSVSPRHLHRELVDQVGAGPLALARTRRAQTARLLIDQTTMPLGEIAFAAGYSSIRQFNDSMRESFGCNPSELRRRKEPLPAGRGQITLRLQHRLPFEGDPLIRFLGGRAIQGVEEVVDGHYRRTVALGTNQSIGTIDLDPTGGEGSVILRVQLEDLRDLNRTVQRCRQLLDLDADPATIAETLGADETLSPLIAAHPGLRVPGAVQGWEVAVRAILGQQVSVAGARTLAGRLVAALGPRLPEPDGGLTHLFPGPEAFADADLPALGVTRQKADAIRAVARALIRGELALDRGVDREEISARLAALPGIGPWTVSYIAMRALGDPDAFPASDLGLRKACRCLGLGTGAREIERHAERWRPWRAYAATHLWESL